VQPSRPCVGYCTRNVGAAVAACARSPCRGVVADLISEASERHTALAGRHGRHHQGVGVDWQRWVRGELPGPEAEPPRLYEAVYGPFFAVCADLDMPLTTHTGAGDGPQGSHRHAIATAVAAVPTPFCVQESRLCVDYCTRKIQPCSPACARPTARATGAGLGGGRCVVGPRR
jgi:hypothetical protein